MWNEKEVTRHLHFMSYPTIIMRDANHFPIQALSKQVFRASNMIKDYKNYTLSITEFVP